MGRPGITYRQVADSCDRMISQGINPTIDKVLADLGTGSKSTIGNFKKQWEATRDSKLSSPTSLSDNITSLITQLSEQLKAEALAINEEHDKQHALELKDRDDLLTEAANRYESLQSKLDTLQENFIHLTSQYDDIKVSLKSEIEARVKAQTESTEKDDKINTLKGQIASLEKKYEHATTSLEHFRTSISDQMKQDQEKWEQAKTTFQHEVSTLKEKVISQNTELASMNQQNGQLVSEIKSLTQQARISKQAESELTSKLNEEKAKASSFSDQYYAQKDINSQLNIENSTLKSELVAANRDVARLESDISELKLQKSSAVESHKSQLEHYQKLLDARDNEISEQQKIILYFHKSGRKTGKKPES